jgi:hypothetical protein
VKNRIGCPKRATAEIGFTAEVALEDGLQALIRWRRSERCRNEPAFTGPEAAMTAQPPREVAAR